MPFISPTPLYRLFFSTQQEKVSFLNYNVSCILVLPHCMQKGYGKVLIDFSEYFIIGVHNTITLFPYIQFKYSIFDVIKRLVSSCQVSTKMFRKTDRNFHSSCLSLRADSTGFPRDEFS